MVTALTDCPTVVDEEPEYGICYGRNRMTETA
jgi:hypothetical protein